MLAFDRLTMDFPGVRALDDVSFSVRPGSIHALLGENGAGKSTLLKILGGALRPTAGTVSVDGRPLPFAGTAGALAAGIAIIHQELHLVPELSVAENLFLGHLPRRAGLVRRAELAAAARRQLALVGESVDPATPVGRLPLARRQMIEIAKALTRGARIIAFDEPTSSLSDREVQRLFGLVRDLRDRGCALLYVSHRMDEIFALCDRATVLRDGRHIETGELAGVSRGALVRRLVGRDVAPLPAGARPASASRGPGLAVDGLAGPGLAAPVSFAAGAGEILGFFGLVGAGRTELFRLLYGAVPATAGTIRIHDRPVALRSPRDALAAGVVLCPEDRKKEGIIPVRSVQENINLSARRRHARAGLLLDETWERANARARIDGLRIRTPSPHQLIRHLSGGNQQKAILGRGLSAPVRIVLFDEPTRGIDIGAKSEIHDLVRRLAADGTCVLVVSSELPEILALADRIAVLREGRLVAIVDRADATEESLLRLALPVAG